MKPIESRAWQGRVAAALQSGHLFIIVPSSHATNHWLTKRIVLFVFISLIALGCGRTQPEPGRVISVQEPTKRELESYLQLRVKEVADKLGLDTDKRHYSFIDEPPLAFRGMAYNEGALSVWILVDNSDPMYHVDRSDQACTFEAFLQATAGGILYKNGDQAIAVGDVPFYWAPD